MSESCKPDYFEPHNSLNLRFTNIRGLSYNFVKCESFLESNSLDILALCEINLNDSIDSDNFSVRGYLPLIQKDSASHMHGIVGGCVISESPQPSSFLNGLLSKWCKLDFELYEIHTKK